MTDLITRLRDYLDTVASPVTVEEIVTHPLAAPRRRSRLHRGPLVAVAAAAVAGVLGAVAVIVQTNGDPQAGGFFVVEEVIAGSEEDSRYAVGFDIDGQLCAEAGASFGSQAVCGGDQLVATAFQGDASLAVAGWAPKSAATLTAIYDGDLRRPLELTPIPGRDLHAFGTVETVRPRFIEIEVVDDTGEIVQRYFPSIGPASD